MVYYMLYFTVYIDPEARSRRQLCVRVACAVRVLGRGQRGKIGGIKHSRMILVHAKC